MQRAHIATAVKAVDIHYAHAEGGGSVPVGTLRRQEKEDRSALLLLWHISQF